MTIVCPPGTHWNASLETEGLQFSVNGRREEGCVRPDGTRHGPAIVRYTDGAEAAQGEYREGMKEGQWRFWHETSQISGEGVFHSGKPEGLWITWHLNGQRESKGHYRAGLQHGRFFYWSPEGKLDRELHFEDGVLIDSGSLDSGEGQNGDC